MLRASHSSLNTSEEIVWARVKDTAPARITGVYAWGPACCLFHDSSPCLPGEGFHNYHHAFPYDYSASEYRYHINFTTFFIDCMALLGLAYDRKKVSKAAVLARIKRTGDGSIKSG